LLSRLNYSSAEIVESFLAWPGTIRQGEEYTSLVLVYLTEGDIDPLMNQQSRNILLAFLQGLTGAGLFRRLDYPGAPNEFVDSRSLEQIKASEEWKHFTSLPGARGEGEITRPIKQHRR
jgi:hypothetical protein